MTDLKNNTKLIEKVNELYHDWEAGHYPERHPEIYIQENDNWQRLADNFLSDEKHKKILDIGCGTGFVAQALKKYLKTGDNFFCSDISSDMLETAKKNLNNGTFKNRFYFLKGSIDELELKPSYFDMITLNSVLHHLPDLNIFLKKVNQILKPGGKLIIFHEPNKIFYRHWFLKNNFLFLGQLKKAYLRFKKTLKGPGNRLNNDKKDVFEHINRVLLQQGLIDTELTRSKIKQLVDFGSPTATGKVDKDRGFDIDELIKRMPSFKILDYITYNYLGKINHNSNFLLNFYNYILSKVWPKKGGSWGAVFQKND